MEDFYDNQDVEHDERQELQMAMQAKKEKFRVKIRQTKNKQLMQAKRMRLANGMNHFPNNQFQIECRKQNDQMSSDDQEKQQILSQNIQLLLQFQSHTKDQVINSLDWISGYLLDGAFHQDIEQLIQIADQLNYIICIDSKSESNSIDCKVVRSATFVMINITYFCDSQQMKSFSTQTILTSVMKLFSFEDIKIRENSFVILHNIIADDKDAVRFLMERFIPQEIISVLTTYGISQQMVLDTAGLIKEIVSNKNIPYSQASEFLISVDELIDNILQQGNFCEESDNGSLSILLECIDIILNKEDSEDVYENFVIEFPRIIGHIVDTVKVIRFNQKFNSTALSISKIFGLLLSGNINTTQILVDSNIFESLHILIKHPKKEVRQESIWSVSNLFVFINVKGIQEYLTDIQFWDTLINIAFQDSKSVSKWAYISIFNALLFNNIEFTEMILERFSETDLIQFIFDKLQDQLYQNVVISLLEALKSLINYGDYCQKQNRYQENHIIVLIQRLNQRPVLEQCQQDVQQDISDTSAYLLDQIY